MSEKKFHSFIGFLKPNEKKTSVFFSTNLDDVIKWRDEDRIRKTAKAKNKKESGEENHDKEIGPEDNYCNKLAELIEKFRKNISSYQVLVFTGMNLFPLMKQKYLEINVYESAKGTLEAIDEDQEYIIFGIDDASVGPVLRHMSAIDDMNVSQEVFPGAVLLSMVATFDSLLGDVIRTMIMSNPARIHNSDKTISISELFSMSSFDDVISKIADEEVTSVMRGSHESQIEYLEKSFGISFPRSHERIGRFFEIFERRNLVAHGSLTINEIYVKNCKRLNYDIKDRKAGDKVRISAGYLISASQILIEFGISIVCLLWAKNFSDRLEDIYDHLNQNCYEMIVNRQFKMAANLLSFGIKHKRPKISDRLYRMIAVNLANAYKSNKEHDKCEEVLNGIDWSAASSEFGVCVAALRGDIDKVVSLMGPAAGEVLASGFREWPVFNSVRSDPRFAAEFKRLFGQEIGGMTIRAEGTIDTVPEAPSGEVSVLH